MAISSFKQQLQPNAANSSPEFQPQENELYLPFQNKQLALEDFKALRNYSKSNLESDLNKNKYLEQLLITFDSDRCLNYIQENIFKPNDIAENWRILIVTPYKTEWFNYLLDVIINEINKGSRFRKLESLKAIKRILKKQIDSSTLMGKLAIENTTTDKLFYIYKAFFFKSKPIQECISVLLKSQKLNEEQIKWIILNYKSSEYAINRLLKYPGKSKALSVWAEHIYITELLKYRQENKSWIDWFNIFNSPGSLLKRESELIAILIDEDIPYFVDKQDKVTLIWAIYFAQIPDNIKKELIKKYYDINSFEAAVEVATRLKYASVLKFIQEKL